MHLIMFDVDGTLIDSGELDGVLYAAAIRDALDVRVDETWRSYQCRTHSGILADVLAAHAAPKDHVHLSERVERRFTDLVQAHIERVGLKAIPGAAKFLARLVSEPGVVVAIATGGWRRTSEMKLRAVGIEHEHLPFATSSDAISKPEIMRLAARQAGPENAFRRKTYFGDTDADQRASAELGYEFVRIGGKVDHSICFGDLGDGEGILSAIRLSAHT